MMNTFTKPRPNRFAQLFAADTRNISRDPALLFAIVLSIALPIGIAVFRPVIDNTAANTLGVTAFTNYIIPVVFCLPAFLTGWVTGFLLLEDRDDGPLMALDVTPMGKAGFFAYRAIVTAIITAAITILCLILLAPQTPLLVAAIIVVLIAIEAVCSAFILPAIARNKVEGLAVTKVINIAAIVPLLVLLPSPLRYIGAIIPSYWIGDLLMDEATQYLSLNVKLALAIIVHVLVALLLYRFASRRIG